MEAAEVVAGRTVGRSLPGSAELPRAARRALRRRESRAGALPRLHFDRAVLLVLDEVTHARKALPEELLHPVVELELLRAGGLG